LPRWDDKHLQCRRGWVLAWVRRSCPSGSAADERPAASAENTCPQPTRPELGAWQISYLCSDATAASPGANDFLHRWLLRDGPVAGSARTPVRPRSDFMHRWADLDLPCCHGCLAWGNRRRLREGILRSDHSCGGARIPALLANGHPVWTARSRNLQLPCSWGSGVGSPVACSDGFCGMTMSCGECTIYLPSI